MQVNRNHLCGRGVAMQRTQINSTFAEISNMVLNTPVGLEFFVTAKLASSRIEKRLLNLSLLSRFPNHRKIR